MLPPYHRPICGFKDDSELKLKNTLLEHFFIWETDSVSSQMCCYCALKESCLYQSTIASIFLYQNWKHIQLHTHACIHKVNWRINCKNQTIAILIRTRWQHRKDRKLKHRATLHKLIKSVFCFWLFLEGNEVLQAVTCLTSSWFVAVKVCFDLILVHLSGFGLIFFIRTTALIGKF